MEAGDKLAVNQTAAGVNHWLRGYLLDASTTAAKKLPCVD